MKTKNWNIAMFATMFAFVLVAMPFFAIASDIDFGGFSDIDFGGFDDIDFGSFDDINFDGVLVPPTPDTDTIFDPFDDDFGPLDDIPGIPPGIDIPTNPDDDDDGCIVDCDVPNPDPTPSPTPSSSERFSIFIHQIFINDMIATEAGNVLPLHLTFESDGTKSLDNTKVIVMIPELGARASVGPMDLKRGRKVSRTLLLEVPSEVEPGTYYVRVNIHSQGTSRVVHREIDII